MYFQLLITDILAKLARLCKKKQITLTIATNPQAHRLGDWSATT